MSFDVIIVGGGVIGLSLAWRLLQAGVSVHVIDAGAAIPSSTAAAAGMLSPSFERGHGGGAHDEQLFRFATESLNMWPEFASELETETGVDIDFRSNGVLGVAFTEAELDDKRAAYQSLKRIGAAPVWLGAHETMALEPALGKDVKGAFFSANEGQTDPRRLIEALRNAVSVRRGALSQGEVVVVRRRQGRVDGVELKTGERVDGGHVVIAAGAVLGGIDCGAPPPPVFPVKGEALSVDAGALTEQTRPRHVIRAARAYLAPKSDGRVIIGATEKPDETGLDVSEAAVSNLRRAAQDIAPAIGDCPEIERWAGLRPGTPDGGPILGRVDDGPEGLVYAIGHFRNGVLLAPKTADTLARSLIGDTERTIAPSGGKSAVTNKAARGENEILNSFNVRRFKQAKTEN